MGKKAKNFSPSDKLAIRKEQITSLLDGKVTKVYGRSVFDLLAILNKYYSFRIVPNLCKGIMEDFIEGQIVIEIGKDAERIRDFFKMLGVKNFSENTLRKYKNVEYSRKEYLTISGLGKYENDWADRALTFDEFLNKLNENESSSDSGVTISNGNLGVTGIDSTCSGVLPTIWDIPTSNICTSKPEYFVDGKPVTGEVLLRKLRNINSNNKKENIMPTNYLETETCVELTEQEREEMRFINQAVKEGMKGFSGTKAEFSQRETELANQAKKEYEAFLKEAELLEAGLEALDLGQLVLKVDERNDTLRTTYMSTPKITTELADGKLVDHVSYITGRTTQSVNDEQDDVIALAVAFYYSKFESNTQAKKFAELVMDMAREEAGIN